MSSEQQQPPYNSVYIQAWIILSVFLGLGLLSTFLFGTQYLAAGKVVWDIIRWLALPII